MFCSECGQSLTGSAAKFCSNCGTPTNPRSDDARPNSQTSNTQAPSSTPSPPAAFYQDPFVPGMLRYWGGGLWAEKSTDSDAVMALLRSGATPAPTHAQVPILPTDPASPGFYTDAADPPYRRFWTGDHWGEAEERTATHSSPVTVPSQGGSLTGAGSGRVGIPTSAPSPQGDVPKVGVWPAWMYSLVIAPSVLLMLVAAATAGSNDGVAAVASQLDDLLGILQFAFVVIFGVWDAQRVRKVTGAGGGLTALAVLIAVAYPFVRQRKLRQSQLPAFTFLGLVLVYFWFVFAAVASSLDGVTGAATCDDLVNESVRISNEQFAGSGTPILITVYDVTLVSDIQDQVTAPSTSRTDLLVCRGTGTFSDSSISDVVMTYSLDPDGNEYITYRPE